VDCHRLQVVALSPFGRQTGRRRRFRVQDDSQGTLKFVDRLRRVGGLCWSVVGWTCS
jgi:hypothetical protein